MSTTTSETHWIPEWDFGDKVRKIRRARGLNQEDFARMLGVKASAASAWESANGRTPRDIVSIAKRIELAFGVPAEWVLGLEMRTAPGPDNGPGGGSQLPRLDSNQQPSGSLFPQVSGLRRVA